MKKEKAESSGTKTAGGAAIDEGKEVVERRGRGIQLRGCDEARWIDENERIAEVRKEYRGRLIKGRRKEAVEGKAGSYSFCIDMRGAGCWVPGGQLPAKRMETRPRRHALEVGLESQQRCRPLSRSWTWTGTWA